MYVTIETVYLNACKKHIVFGEKKTVGTVITLIAVGTV
jgi:hypothetical protein